MRLAEILITFILLLCNAVTLFILYLYSWCG